MLHFPALAKTCHKSGQFWCFKFLPPLRIMFQSLFSVIGRQMLGAGTWLGGTAYAFHARGSSPDLHRRERTGMDSSATVHTPRPPTLPPTLYHTLRRPCQQFPVYPLFAKASKCHSHFYPQKAAQQILSRDALGSPSGLCPAQCVPLVAPLAIPVPCSLATVATP